MLVTFCHPADRGARIAPNTVIEDDIEDASVRAGAALRPFSGRVDPLSETAIG
jgi:hypothetical protein